jgi:hypothetical protein
MEETYTSFEHTDDDVRDNSHLAKQTLENLDISKLTPLSPEVISRQATINIGMCLYLVLVLASIKRH